MIQINVTLCTKFAKKNKNCIASVCQPTLNGAVDANDVRKGASGKM